MVIADLHIHGRYSRATSPKLDIPNLEKWGKIKGVDIFGTGDFQHPLWNTHLKEHLIEDDSGILKTPSGSKFILQSEISLMYTQNLKGRRVHHVLLAPSFEVVDQITEAFLKKGRIDYDGRPIFGFTSIELVEMMKEISDDIEIIPAHAWTPWFGILGSKSGFDSVEECFGDKVKHIHAIETGLSSDPSMNWRISSLDKFNLVSSSDSHSFWPWRVGREATIFDCEVSYNAILKAIRTGEGLHSTIEVDPGYGKYHFDGHRKCGVCFSPSESIKHNGRCPKCNRPLTIGVLNRVEKLADRPEGFRLDGAPGFKRLIPLSELLSGFLGVKQLYSKNVFAKYMSIVDKFNSEFDVLLNESKDSLLKVLDSKLVDIIMSNRRGLIKVKAGYDGVYGEPNFSVGPQKTLGDF
ncbi:endonuclease Q family protein [archaeon]|nr:endonuclease Q family protein [archaeon]